MIKSIVAGVDGSESALDAVAWAARHSLTLGVPLLLVHGFQTWAFDTPIPNREARQERGHQLVGEAAAHARLFAPGVEIATQVVPGRPEDVLVAFSVVARMVVVGCRGLSGIAELIIGSTSHGLTTHSHSPVVVLRAPASGTDIVAGIGGTSDEERVLEFAFTQADALGVRLRLVHAWNHPMSRTAGDLVPHVYTDEQIDGAESRLLAETIAGWRTKFPDVPVIEITEHASPVQALIEASRDAAMVVAGRHGRCGMGTICHALLHQASCPVSIIPYR